MHKTDAQDATEKLCDQELNKIYEVVSPGRERWALHLGLSQGYGVVHARRLSGGGEGKVFVPGGGSPSEGRANPSWDRRGSGQPPHSTARVPVLLAQSPAPFWALQVVAGWWADLPRKLCRGPLPGTTLLQGQPASPGISFPLKFVFSHKADFPPTFRCPSPFPFHAPVPK